MGAAGVTLTLLVLRGTVVLAGALLAGRLLRRAPARTRHGLWTQALLGLALLPALTLTLPTLPLPGLPAISWDGPAAGPALPAERAGDLVDSEPRAGALPDHAGGAGASRQNGDAAGVPGAVSGASSAADRERAGGVTLERFLEVIPGAALAAWIGGTGLVLAALLLSLLRTAALTRSAVPPDASVRKVADRLQRYLGLRRPVRVLLSPRIGTPMAGGLLRPTIFLPTAARGWAADRLRVVLLHELIHVRRHDPHRNLLARVALAPYWFHPLAWIAARRVVIERERACDEAVVEMGTRPSSYARHLLELADTLPRCAPAPMAALSMIQRSLLERRVMSILDPTPRRTGRRVGLATCLILILGTGLVAAAGPASPARPQEDESAGAGVATGSTGSALRAEGLGQLAGVGAAVSAAGSAIAGASAALASLPEGAQARSELPADSACWWTLEGGSHFSGSMSFSDQDGVRYQIGHRDGDRIVQVTENGRRLCLRSDGDVAFDEAGMPSVHGDGRVLLETRADGDMQSMEISGSATTWSVNGEQRPVDASAERWRDALLQVLGDHWRMSRIRGEVSSLRGEISSLRGRASSLRGEISSLRGEVSSMRGHISSLRGQESSMRGRISSIRGRVSSMRGAISSERGSISALRAGLYRADAAERQRIDERIAGHEAEIARIEQELRDYDADARVAEVEAEISELGTAARIAETEQRIAEFDLDARVATIEERIDALQVGRHEQEIERQIEALDAERRIEQIRAELETHRTELEGAIAAIL